MHTSVALAVTILGASVAGLESSQLSAYESEQRTLVAAMMSAGPSIQSVGATATGIPGLAWRSWENLKTEGVHTNEAEAASYINAVQSLASLLPTEVQSYYSSIGDGILSIKSKYSVTYPTDNPTGPAPTPYSDPPSGSATESTTATSTDAAKTGGAEKLAVGMAVIGLGAVAVLL